MSTSIHEAFVLPDNPHLGDRVLYRMKVKNINRTQLAALLNCGVGTVSNIIKTGKCHCVIRLKNMAWHLDTTPNWLTGVEGTKAQGKPVHTCGKSFCGEKAHFVVLRQNQPRSSAEKCCGNHVVYFVSRDHKSEVYPLAKWLEEFEEVANVG